ncbi:AmmeMemoRadiSam system protein A [bacterium]|nr:AmmeMemoRadiSam system protein A [bacterium]
MNSPHVMLAMSAIDSYLHEGSLPGVPADIPNELLTTRAGAFVCLKCDGQLRGCIGTIEPVMDSLALEIMENAVSAATRDPRFMPVELRELDGIDCSVDVLSPSEPVHDLIELDPKRYGVIVESEGRRGLLLPDLDGVDTAEQQIDIARRKAYIHSHEPVKLYRFEVLRYY